LSDLFTKLILGQVEIVACHTIHVEGSDGINDGSEVALSGSSVFVLGRDVLDMLSRKRKQSELLIGVRGGLCLGLDLGYPVQYRVMTPDWRWTRLRYSWALGSRARSVGPIRVCAMS
jgi:hypothetical protein